jgi:DNA invertase Pin-like site-specific DNA recombinase
MTPSCRIFHTSRQVENARAYANANGWLVDEAHIYIDDGISGAEFATRLGLSRLLLALKPESGFQILIVADESRLGRETIETAYVLKQLITAGVRVFSYLEKRAHAQHADREGDAGVAGDER